MVYLTIMPDAAVILTIGASNSMAATQPSPHIAKYSLLLDHPPAAMLHKINHRNI